MKQNIHIDPINDLEKHKLIGIDCKCNPRIEELNDETTLIIHNSFDGREGLELAKEVLKRECGLPTHCQSKKDGVCDLPMDSCTQCIDNMLSFSIYINGRIFNWLKKRITYEEVTKLYYVYYGRNLNYNPSVTFHAKERGILHSGEQILVSNGMRFNIAHTGNS